MAAEMRAMLDQLMGAERDVPLEQRVNRKKLFTVRELNFVFSREKLSSGADDHGKCVFSLSLLLLLLLLLLLSLTPARVVVVPFILSH
jgi:hypothetical protein